MSVLGDVVLPIFQILAAIGTGFAAVAAWRSSSAARRSADASEKTAGRADETARRAMEALGWATIPLLRIEIVAGPSVERSGPGPVEVPLVLVNMGASRALIHSALMIRTDLDQTFTARESMPLRLGRQTSADDISFTTFLYFGPMPRVMPAATERFDSGPEITVEVEFTDDTTRAVRWVRRSRWAEWVRFDDQGQPVYSYMRVDEADPEITSKDSA